MEKKKIDVLFCVLVVAFIVIFIVLIKDLNAKRAHDYKVYSNSVANIVRMKNVQIRVLSNILAAKEKENMDLKNTLADTRNDLVALSKKLGQPIPASAAK